MTHEELANDCVKNNVCCKCGGKLCTAKIQDMLYPQVICPECKCIDWGCKPDIYKIAEKVADEATDVYTRMVNIERMVYLIIKIDAYRQKEVI